MKGCQFETTSSSSDEGWLLVYAEERDGAGGGSRTRAASKRRLADGARPRCLVDNSLSSGVLWSSPLQDFSLVGLRVFPNCNASLLCVLNKWRSIRILGDVGMLNSGSEAVAIPVRGRRDVSPHDGGSPRRLDGRLMILLDRHTFEAEQYRGPCHHLEEARRRCDLALVKILPPRAFCSLW